MACEQRPNRDEETVSVLKRGLGERYEAWVDEKLAEAGKKIGTFANYLDRDRKLLKYISTSKEVEEVSRILNDVKLDNMNWAKQATKFFDFMHNEVSKEDGITLTRALGGDLKGDIPPHLKELHAMVRAKIDEMSDALVEVGAMAEKSKMENYLKRYYTQYLEESQKAESFFAKGKSMSGEKVFKRKDLTLDQRLELGMVEDAGLVVANTLMDQQKQLSRYKILQQFADAFAVDEMKDGYVRVPDENLATGVKKWGALSGKYVPDDVMMELRNASEISGAISWMDKNFLTATVDHIKVNVTVKNPATHAYNVASNLQLAYLNGDSLALGEFMTLSKQKRQQIWELARTHGLEGELQEFEALSAKVKVEQVKEKDKNLLLSIVKNLYLAEGTKAGSAFRKAYQWEDEVFKVASFYKRLKKLEKPSDVEVKQALKEAMADYVDYSTPLPPLIRRLDKNGLFPFSHYVWKSTPRVGMIMLKNPLKVLALQAALYWKDAGIFNDNEDDFVKPHWAKETGLFGLFKYLPSNLFGAKQWVHTFGDNHINLGRSLPGARLGGLSVDLGFVGGMVSLIQGRDPLFKQKLYKEEDSTVTAIVKSLKKATVNYLPPVTFGRYMQQWVGIASGNAPKNHYGEDLSIGESMQRLVGVRKFNATKEVTNSIKALIKQWGYDNIDNKEMEHRINEIKSYAKEHGVKVDNKKINASLKRARRKKPKLEKDFYYWLNKYTDVK